MTDKQLKAQFSSATDNWETPHDLFDRYNSRYHFNLDAAASEDNKKCDKFFSVADDGLSQDWSGCNVWMNPPYGREIGRWVQKAYEESQKPNTIVVCLLPARVDTRWFHDYCSKGEITFLKGRLKFGHSKNSAPFPSMIVVFGKRIEDNPIRLIWEQMLKGDIT